MTKKEIEFVIERASRKFSAHSRFFMGLTLASIYHRNGKESFCQNCFALGFNTDQIAAMLVELGTPNSLPTRDGYTPEKE